MTKTELLELKNKFKLKWPTPPVKYSKEWWGYRSDQSYYRMLEDRVKIFDSSNKL